MDFRSTKATINGNGITVDDDCRYCSAVSADTQTKIKTENVSQLTYDSFDSELNASQELTHFRPFATDSTN